MACNKQNARQKVQLRLTQSRVHFSFALVDLVFSRAAAVADASAHLLISVGLRTVGQTMTGLPAVKTHLRREQQGGRVSK